MSADITLSFLDHDGVLPFEVDLLQISDGQSIITLLNVDSYSGAVPENATYLHLTLL